MKTSVRVLLTLVSAMVWSLPAMAQGQDQLGFPSLAGFSDGADPQANDAAGAHDIDAKMSQYGTTPLPQPAPNLAGWRDANEPPLPPCPRRLPLLTVSGDLVVMDRVGGRPATLISRLDTGAELLNVTDLNFSFAPGARIDGIVHGNCGWDLEIAGMGIDNFNASAYRMETGTGIQFAAPNFSAVSVTPGDALRFDYSTRLYTAEASLRNHFSERLTLLGGFRWAELTERFDGSFYSPSADLALPFWTNRVQNHLYGFQVGGDLLVYDGGTLRIDAVAKAGIYGNHASQETTSTFPTPYPGASASINRGAFLGEVGITAVWRATQRLSYRFGYQAMWLDGVALSPNQAHVTDVTTGDAAVDAAGTVFFHGAVFGLEAQF